MKEQHVIFKDINNSNQRRYQYHFLHYRKCFCSPNYLTITNILLRYAKYNVHPNQLSGLYYSPHRLKPTKERNWRKHAVNLTKGQCKWPNNSKCKRPTTNVATQGANKKPNKPINKIKIWNQPTKQDQTQGA